MSSEILRLSSDILGLTELFYVWWISQKAYVFINTAFLVSKDQEGHPLSKIKGSQTSLALHSSLIPSVSLSYSWNMHPAISLPWRTTQGHLAPLRLKLKLHYLSHKPFSLWSHHLSLHSVLGILNTPVSPESFLHLCFGLFWSLC